MDKHGIELNHFVGGALINMYSRCGDIDEAQRVFEQMKEKNVITYNSMIMGFALHGKSVEAIELFRGLAELGFEIFHSMAKDYGIEPQIEHYGCMVDLLGRLGRLEEAYGFIRMMKVAPDHVMLGALLSACKIHGNLELAEQVAKSLVACKNADSGTYILLSNAYSSSGKWKEAAEVRTNMREEGIEKEPGCSSIEVNNEIHEFLLGDLRHPQKEKIYKKLEELNQILRLEDILQRQRLCCMILRNQKKNGL
ncbi:hypothetical protein NC653_007698 [Populus alba x Populus x berolinensis]|uniref:Pentatricopeptide repeat-containing protein n=1 Tax=Populus alba x Populus x berolinensis TaxID=444605 RepID=A0AAD6RHJ4_9ROSI|nr:hypothetical protein NC653_007698 [Populus alba x Populus x berolinensis]